MSEFDFAEFDNMVNLAEMKKDIDEAVKNGGTDYPEIPAGKYKVSLKKLELGTTKDKRPMVKGQFQIVEGKFKKQNIFYNRVIYGTKNDSNMIASALGFLKSLGVTEEVGPITFEGYKQFSELLLDIAEDCSGALIYTVDYDPEKFNSISVKDFEEV